MKIEKNSRQVPSSKVYTSDDQYHDLIWGLLQVHSYLDGDNRYVNKGDVNFKKWAEEELRMSRQTASRYFKDLEQMQIIKYDWEYDRYLLLNLNPKESTLVPYETLRILYHGCSEDTVSVYVYILKNWYRHAESPYRITLRELKDFTGRTRNTGSNNRLFTDIFIVLKNLKLIDYEIKWESADRSCFYITKVSNKIVC